MKNLCIECKYYKQGVHNRLGHCNLTGRSMYPDETCPNHREIDYEKSEVSKQNTYAELEKRVEELEKIVKLLMKAI